MTRYTYLEAEAMDEMYDEGHRLVDIAESINRDFHESNKVRNASSVGYVIRQIYSDEKWHKNLFKRWMAEVAPTPENTKVVPYE